MITVTKLRSGVCFEHNGDPWRVMEYKHVHLSRGPGSVKLKARNLRSGSVKSLHFRSTKKVREVEVERRPCKLLYIRGNDLILMDEESFDQFPVDEKAVGGKRAFLKQGMSLEVLFWGGEPLDLGIPNQVTYGVVEANPGVRGDTVSGATKEVVLETGLKLRVPLFVKKGDGVVVDTRSGEYVERG